MLTYAVGDLHGRFDLLSRALNRIDQHAAGADRRIVFLGDYIDRGPDSRLVVERLMALSEEGRAVCLKGNHEQMAVEACYFGEADHWLDNGGEETLISYGGQIPPRHIKWMDGLPAFYRDDHRIYVHAGTLSGIKDPDEDVALWVRERFLRLTAESFGGFHVVHGHTPRWAGKPVAAIPELLGHRTNLDTEAYASGVLSVGVFSTGSSGGPAEVLTVT